MARLIQTLSPDFWLPETFSLSDGNVQAIETSPLDPKVRMDQTGFFATDATGAKVASINPDGSGIFQGGLKLTSPVLPGSLTPVSNPPDAIQWIRQSDGAVLAEIWEYSQTAYFGPPGPSRNAIDGTVNIIAHSLAASGHPASVNVEAVDDVSGLVGSLTVNGSPGAQSVFLNAGNVKKRLLDQTGQSDFLQPSVVLAAANGGADEHLVNNNQWQRIHFANGSDIGIDIIVNSPQEKWLVFAKLAVYADSGNWTGVSARVPAFTGSLAVPGGYVGDAAAETFVTVYGTQAIQPWIVQTIIPWGINSFSVGQYNFRLEARANLLTGPFGANATRGSAVNAMLGAIRVTSQ
jgi:hypothetical protein